MGDLTICCYKCGAENSLFMEEKRNAETGELIEKKFICLKCAGREKKVSDLNNSGE